MNLVANEQLHTFHTQEKQLKLFGLLTPIAISRCIDYDTPPTMVMNSSSDPEECDESLPLPAVHFFHNENHVSTAVTGNQEAHWFPEPHVQLAGVKWGSTPEPDYQRRRVALRQNVAFPQLSEKLPSACATISLLPLGPLWRFSSPFSTSWCVLLQTIQHTEVKSQRNLFP